MRVRWTQVAFTELNEIQSYIAKENPTAAKAIVRRIEQAVGRLERFPQMGAATENRGVRIFPALPFPYLIFYSIEADELIIRNVRHASRRRPTG